MKLLLLVLGKVIHQPYISLRKKHGDFLDANCYQIDRNQSLIADAAPKGSSQSINLYIHGSLRVPSMPPPQEIRPIEGLLRDHGS